MLLLLLVLVLLYLLMLLLMLLVLPKLRLKLHRMRVQGLTMLILTHHRLLRLSMDYVWSTHMRWRWHPISHLAVRLLMLGILLRVAHR
jgi:hypothetical protein